MINRLCRMAKMSLLLLKCASQMSAQIANASTVFEESPLWCVCGGCSEMPIEKERVCYKNKEYGHQNPLFEHHVLFEPTLELAMHNNADHLLTEAITLLTEATMPVDGLQLTASTVSGPGVG